MFRPKSMAPWFVAFALGFYVRDLLQNMAPPPSNLPHSTNLVPLMQDYVRKAPSRNLESQLGSNIAKRTGDGTTLPLGRAQRPLGSVHQAMDRLCVTPTVAVMYSGQWSRFLFRDNKRTLIAWNSSDAACGTPRVDVYIALHKGTPAIPYKGSFAAAPYMNETTSLEEIRQYFLRERGADRVFIQLVDDEHMDAMQTRLVEKVTNRFLPPGNPVSALYNKHYALRFKPYSKMFYMRYLAYRMTMSQQYTAYVGLRDDDFMYEPLNFSNIGYNHTLALQLNGDDSRTDPFDDLRDARPYVVVEDSCKWYDASSDKIHVGNSMAMTTLYGENWPSFVQRMMHWIHFAFVRSTAKEGTYANEDPFQTEAKLKDLLKGGVKLKADLNRIDARYMNGTLCAFPLYYNCKPRRVRERLEQIGLPKCVEGV